MPDILVSRDEFNGLGKKIEIINEQRIQCKTKTETDLKYIALEQKEMKEDLRDINTNLDVVSDKVSQLTVKISVIVSIVVALINLVFPVLIKMLGI